MPIVLIGEGIVEDMIHVVINDGDSIDEILLVNKNAIDGECQKEENTKIVDLIGLEERNDRIEIRVKDRESVTLIVIPWHRVVSIIYHYGKRVKCNESDNV